MKCKQGDAAKIICSMNPENIGRAVKVVEYIGKFDKGEKFMFRELECECPITDHYWWIEAHDLTIYFGPSPRAYIADTWLEPIRPDNELFKETSKKQLDMYFK